MKLFISLLASLLLVLSTSTAARAACVGEDCQDFEGGGGRGGTGSPTFQSGSNTGVPEISDIADPLLRVFNILTLAGGFVFMMMIFYSAYKYSLAQGDPKGIIGAKDTLTHAIFGFIVTIGAFAIITIVSNIFGLDTKITDDPGGSSKSAIQQLVDFLKL